jgi:hypothetical protein
MLDLVLAVSFILAAPPDLPRLQWAYDGGRVLNRYDGKWAEVTSKGPTPLVETARTPEYVELTDPATKRLIRLTSTDYQVKKGNKFQTFLLGSWTTEFKSIDLGALSEKYESGGRGPGTVSTGIGDPGGVSYGTYQLASKIGRADEFVKRYYPNEFVGLKGGTPEFTARWKELATKDPSGLHANEHAYIKETHFDPQVEKLAADLGLDVAKRSRVFQDAVWSTAVQHGPRTDVITTALKPLLANKAIDELTEPEILRAIYAERGRKNPDGTLARFRRVSPDWIPGLTRRFVNELKDALTALEVNE